MGDALNGQELIGWASSMILFATIVKQVHKQWRDDTSEGVSKWLYIGQLAAEAGFVWYSWLVSNWVFVVTNAMVFAANVTGLVILYRHRRRAARDSAARHAPPRSNRVKASLS